MLGKQITCLFPTSTFDHLDSITNKNEITKKTRAEEYIEDMEERKW
jgi:hypothetical protein